jgi:uncharacterized membrane protein
LKKIPLYLMGAAYVLAGLNHFLRPDFYMKMLEGFLPYPKALNYISGAAEILLGIGVMIPATRKLSAWGLILLLIAIFPANINMAIHASEWNFSAAMLYLRLPIQLLLIGWAYQYTKEGIASS